MRVAVLYEYSGIVRDAFIAAGHDSVSCDILPSESVGPHIQGDVRDYDWSEYDLIIAHPPCTHMSVSGNRWWAGTPERKEAAELIDWTWNIPVEKLAIENPVGQINKYLPHMPKPQYIQPWQFGHSEQKKTGLWLRGLPCLIPTKPRLIPPKIVNGRAQRVWKIPPAPDRGKERSRTFEGIAQAMAEQWGLIDSMEAER